MAEGADQIKRRPAAAARGTLEAGAKGYLAQVKHLASFKSRACEINAWRALYTGPGQPSEALPDHRRTRQEGARGLDHGKRHIEDLPQPNPDLAKPVSRAGRRRGADTGRHDQKLRVPASIKVKKPKTSRSRRSLTGTQWPPPQANLRPRGKIASLRDHSEVIRIRLTKETEDEASLGGLRGRRDHARDWTVAWSLTNVSSTGRRCTCKVPVSRRGDSSRSARFAPVELYLWHQTMHRPCRFRFHERYRERYGTAMLLMHPPETRTRVTSEMRILTLIAGTGLLMMASCVPQTVSGIAPAACACDATETSFATLFDCTCPRINLSLVTEYRCTGTVGRRSAAVVSSASLRCDWRFKRPPIPKWPWPWPWEP